MLKRIFLRDIAFSFRHGGGALISLSFYMLAFMLFAFGLGPQALSKVVVEVLSVNLLLSLLISLPFLFERDAEDGTLEAYLVQPLAAEWLCASKIAAYWVSQALPLVLFAPLLSYLSGDTAMPWGMYLLRLACASIALVSTGALAAALTLQQRNGVLARALVVLPLNIPVLIFMVAEEGQAMAALLLGAWALLMFPVACMLSAALIRES